MGYYHAGGNEGVAKSSQGLETLIPSQSEGCGNRGSAQETAASLAWMAFELPSGNPAVDAGAHDVHRGHWQLRQDNRHRAI
jgi:hypothetical protein